MGRESKASNITMNQTVASLRSAAAGHRGRYRAGRLMTSGEPLPTAKEMPFESPRLAGLVGLGTGTQPALLKRMDDRRFTELDLRRMLERATGYRPDVEGRWVIETRHRRRPWEVIVEPDQERQLLVVVTAYPVWE
jgi:hypothetical protein